jgi:hypothetical protein
MRKKIKIITTRALGTITLKRIKRFAFVLFLTKVLGVPVVLLSLGFLFFTGLSGFLNYILADAGDDSLPDWRVLLGCMVMTMVGHEVLVYVSYFHFAGTELNAELLMKDEDINRSFDELKEVLKNKRNTIIEGYSEPYRLWCKTEMLVNDVNMVTEIEQIKEKRKNEIL